MTSFIRSQLDEGPLGPKERNIEGGGEPWGKEKDRERDVYSPRLYLP